MNDHLNTTERAAAESEAHAATHSAVISDLRNTTPLGRLNMDEVRAVLHRLADQGYAITKAPSAAAAKVQMTELGRAKA